MPAAHSPPMPKPKSARRAKSIPYDVEKPLRKAKIENHNTDSISGSFRPHLSAAVPAMVPPMSRIMSVTVPSNPARARSTVKLCWMSMMMNARMLKSNESTTQPRKTAQNARHCSRVTCRYQGSSETMSRSSPRRPTSSGVLTCRDSSCPQKCLSTRAFNDCTPDVTTV